MATPFKDIQLTPNFKLSEFIGTPEAAPSAEVLKNLTHLAHRLQALRDIVGKPVVITSGYRTPEHNRRIGGVQDSYHTRGMAADITIPGMAPAQVQAFLANWSGGMGPTPPIPTWISGHTRPAGRPRRNNPVSKRAVRFYTGFFGTLCRHHKPEDRSLIHHAIHRNAAAMQLNQLLG